MQHFLGPVQNKSLDLTRSGSKAKATMNIKYIGINNFKRGFFIENIMDHRGLHRGHRPPSIIMDLTRLGQWPASCGWDLLCLLCALGYLDCHSLDHQVALEMTVCAVSRPAGPKTNDAPMFQICLRNWRLCCSSFWNVPCPTGQHEEEYKVIVHVTKCWLREMPEDGWCVKRGWAPDLRIPPQRVKSSCMNMHHFVRRVQRRNQFTNLRRRNLHEV